MNQNRALSALALGLACMSSAFAVDGVTLIGQANLNAGGGFYTITQPGSYRLSGNIDAPGTVCDQIVSGVLSCAILVKASNVTLDLNGFRLRTSGEQTSAILTASQEANHLRVMNGSIVSNVPLFGFFAGPSIIGNVVLKELTIEPLTAALVPIGSQDTFLVQGVYAPKFDFLSSSGACPALVTGSVFRSIKGACTAVGNSTSP